MVPAFVWRGVLVRNPLPSDRTGVTCTREVIAVHRTLRKLLAARAQTEVALEGLG